LEISVIAKSLSEVMTLEAGGLLRLFRVRARAKKWGKGLGFFG
jgi:hypothetical protein